VTTKVNIPQSVKDSDLAIIHTPSEILSPPGVAQSALTGCNQPHTRWDMSLRFLWPIGPGILTGPPLPSDEPVG